MRAGRQLLAGDAPPNVRSLLGQLETPQLAFADVESQFVDEERIRVSLAPFFSEQSEEERSSGLVCPLPRAFFGWWAPKKSSPSQ